jgi:3'-phosphoadenosine 5'-phosphosulfate sulfotransferase (PAPS reductase)/FAD synthetase
LNGEALDKDGNPSQYNIPQWKFLLYAPFDISHKCCDVMKKNPSKDYEKKNKATPIIGTMTEESKLRQTKWLQHGCNAFDTKRKTSQPMSFWTENDVLTYIHTYIQA